MKAIVFPTPKIGGVTGQGETKNIPSLLRWKPLASYYVGSITQRIGDLGKPLTHLDGQSHLVRITRTSAFPKEGITTHSYPIDVSIKFHYIRLIHHKSWLLE